MMEKIMSGVLTFLSIVSTELLVLIPFFDDRK